MNALMDLEDQELIELAATDPDAFDALYRRYVLPVYRYTYSRTNSVPDAEDLTAQTFLACLEGIQRSKVRGNFSPWLFGIARHKCADFYRSQYGDRRDFIGDEIESLPDDAEEKNPETQADMQNLLECVEHGLPQISPDRVDALRLRYWGALSIADVAHVMQRSQAAVKMLISRAITDLRERCVRDE